MLSATIRERGPWTLVHLHGELDMATTRILVNEVFPAMAAGPRRLVLDLRDLWFIDICGASAIDRMCKLAEQLDVDLCVVNPTALGSIVLAAVGLHVPPQPSMDIWKEIRAARVRCAHLDADLLGGTPVVQGQR